MTALVVVKDPLFDRWYCRRSESLCDPGANDSAFLEFCRRTNGDTTSAAKGLFETGNKLWQSSLYTAYGYEQVIRTAKISGAEWLYECRSGGWFIARLGSQTLEFIPLAGTHKRRISHGTKAVNKWLRSTQPLGATEL